jgi:hypothetical protein
VPPQSLSAPRPKNRPWERLTEVQHMKLPEQKWLLLDRWPPIVKIAPCLSGEAELLAIVADAMGKKLGKRRAKSPFARSRTFTVSDLRELAKDGGDLNKVFATYSPEQLGLKFKKMEDQNFDGLAIKWVGRDGHVNVWRVMRV